MVLGLAPCVYSLGGHFCGAMSLANGDGGVNMTDILLGLLVLPLGDMALLALIGLLWYAGQQTRRLVGVVLRGKGR